MGKSGRKGAQAARPSHGEDYLQHLEAIKITLENGQTVTFRRDRELRIPDDPTLLVRAARNAPSRLEFWAYQAERALREVRRLEIRERQVLGELALTYRQYFKDETEETFITDTMVRERVDYDDTATSARANLNKARHQYNLLRWFRDAQEHRCFVIRRLVAQREAETRGV